MMFTYRLIISIIVLNCLLHVNNALQASSHNKNLTCEEFCAISKASGNAFRADATAASYRYQNHDEELPQQLIVKDQIFGDTRQPLNKWYHQRHRHRSVANEEYLRQSSIIFGMTQIANEDYLNPQCFQNLKELGTSVLRKDVWAMKVLDSSGSKKSGFLWGNNYWLGSKGGCEAAQEPVYITLSDQYERAMKMGLIHDLAPYQMEYRVIYIRHNSPWQVEINLMTERIIHVGLCLPKSCSNAEVYNMTQTYMDWGFFEEANIYDIKPEVIYIKDLKLNDSFYDKISVKIVAGAFALTGILVSLAMCQNPLADGKKSNVEQNYNAPGEDNSKEKLNEPRSVEVKDKSGKGQSIYNFIRCFDLMKNGRSLFSFENASPNSIPVINGLRSLSCIYIMVFHVMYYMYFTVDNKTFLVSVAERPFFQYVSSAPLLVDVFFTISGFLSVYNFIRNEKNVQKIANSTSMENFKTFGKMILHRYLRLAPLYLIVMGMVEVFTTYAEDVSIFHIHERYDQICPNYWWRNIFFVQNFFSHEKMCLNWTWSLACEMQYYVLGLAALFCYVKYPRTVKTLTVLACLSSILWSVSVCVQYKFRLSFDVMYNTGTQIYINPFVRVTPYIIGSMAGWFLATSKGQFSLNATFEKCSWNTAILIFISCIYSTVKRDMSDFLTIALWTLGRTFYSFAVSWMILGSATGRGVWWSRLLEFKGFQHINKISYGFYLLNPFVVSVVFSMSNTSTNADPIMLFIQAAGFIWYVYLVSVIFTLCFEIPYCNLSSLLLRRKVKTA